MKNAAKKNTNAPNAKVAPQAAHVAPAKGGSGKQATAKENATPRARGAKGGNRKATNAGKQGRAKQAGKPRENSKKAQVLALLKRKEGATLEQMLKATGWQAHSVRGFLSGALGKKMG